MPLVKKIESKNGMLGIWKFSEPVSQLILMFQFSEQEKIEFKRLIADKRKTEYLSARLLLHELLSTKDEIQYHSSGKPKLKNTKLNISISHSSDFLVIFLSEKKIGVDIENTSRNIKKVAFRFLHKDELQHLQNLANTQVASILYWGAKEAIFKCTMEQGVQFNKQIFIPTFNIKNKGTFKGSYLSASSETNYKLWYFFYENNVVVYCVE